jgi:hypothetical protein
MLPLAVPWHHTCSSLPTHRELKTCVPVIITSVLTRTHTGCLLPGSTDTHVHILAAYCQVQQIHTYTRAYCQCLHIHICLLSVVTYACLSVSTTHAHMPTLSFNKCTCYDCQFQHMHMCLLSVPTHTPAHTISVNTYACVYCHCHHKYVCLPPISSHSHVPTVSVNKRMCIIPESSNTCSYSVSSHTQVRVCDRFHARNIEETQMVYFNLLPLLLNDQLPILEVFQTSK